MNHNINMDGKTTSGDGENHLAAPRSPEDGVGDSVRSDHPDDYYHDDYYRDDDDDDDDDDAGECDDDDDDGGSCRSSLASSVRSLQSREIDDPASSSARPRDHAHHGGNGDRDDCRRPPPTRADDGNGKFHRKTSSLYDDDDDDDGDIIRGDDDRDGPYSSYGGGGGGGGGGSASDYHDRDDDDDDYDYDDDDDDDSSLGFPPGHITRLDELNDLQNAAPVPRALLHHHRDATKADVNPSVIPSYFFCPLTRAIMKDPVITPYGCTYERRAILRYLVLEAADPMSSGKKALRHEDLVEDRLVRQAIDRARKESWVRYIAELPDEGGDGGIGGGGGDDGEDDDDDGIDDDVVDRIIVVETDRGEKGDGRGGTWEKGNDSSMTFLSDSITPPSIGGDNGSGKSLLVLNGDYGEPSSPIKNAFEDKIIINKILLATLTPTPKSRRGRDGLHHPSAQHEAAVPANHRLDQVVSIPPPPLASPATSTPSSTAVVVFGGATPSSSSPRNNHGWSVPLGVHRITCAPPGLAVTIDVHRRSNVVKRKIIRKSLVGQEVVVGGGNNNDATTSTSNRLKKMKRNHGRKKGGGGGDFKIVTGVITRDLILPPGSYVEVMETRVHGGRVRGRIVWEEEVTTEVDRDLLLHLEEKEVRERAMARPDKQRRRQQQQQQRAVDDGSPGRRNNRGGKAEKAMTKAMTVFRRKTSAGAGGLFTSELFDQPPPHHPRQHSPAGGGGGGARGRERGPSADSPSHLTTIKYGGWISLQWAGGDDNYERDEVVGRSAAAAAAADEDEGPWSRPLPLGVYRVCVAVGNARESGVVANDDDQDVVGDSLSSFAGQLPLHDAPDDESNAIDFLVTGQCVEVVETRVLVVKKKRAKDGGGRHGATGTANNRPPGGDDAAGEQVVRARCMVPVITPPNNSAGGFGGGKPQRKFRFGWITLVGGGASSGTDYSSVAAFPIQLGAYVVTAEDPPVNGNAADSKAKFASGSVSDNSSL